jgi:hypothetical protein
MDYNCEFETFFAHKIAVFAFPNFFISPPQSLPSGASNQTMGFFHFTSDKVVRRLRWLMIAVMFFDMVNTLAMQPKTYWQHPDGALEANHFFRIFLTRGLAVYVPAAIVYALGAFLLVSVLPRRLALCVICAFIFGHYYGACTWLDFHWRFGISGPIIYGIVLGVIFVLLAFPPNVEKAPPTT